MLNATEPVKISAVHFLHSELSSAMCLAVKAGTSFKMGCDHTNYPCHVTAASKILSNLAGDLSTP